MPDQNDKVKSFSTVEKRLASFGFAFKGIFYAFRSQPNFRIHSIIAFFVIVAGFLFQISTFEWLMVIIAICIVLVAELINTSIEKLTDIVSPEKNDDAGHTKDLAAAAVLMAAISAAIIGLIIFIPKIFGLLLSSF